MVQRVLLEDHSDAYRYRRMFSCSETEQPRKKYSDQVENILIQTDKPMAVAIPLGV